ncbi:MAG: MBL fold metallo-hydrolase [Clostridia bacterium]|nr:MBL fold metallo-hydrolase [Clostridia bacterium]
MKLTVLGKYGPFPKVNGATSSYLLKIGGKNVLIDCGAGAFSRLTTLIKPEEIDVIFLSHFHFDHTSDMGVLIYYYQSLFAKGHTKKPVVFCPDDGGALVDSVINCPYFDVNLVRGGEISMFDDIDFEFFEMRHPVQSVGVKISRGGKVFAYTGDTNICDGLNDLFAGSNLVLADGAFLCKDWNQNLPHLSVEYIVELSKKYGNRSIISHINPKYDEEELQKAVENTNCEIAQEGKSYSL